MVTAGLHGEHVEDVCMSVRGRGAWACASMCGGEGSWKQTSKRSRVRVTLGIHEFITKDVKRCKTDKNWRVTRDCDEKKAAIETRKGK